MGTWGGDSVPDRDYGRFARLLAAGRFPVRHFCRRPTALKTSIRRWTISHGQDRPPADRHVEKADAMRIGIDFDNTIVATTACFTPRRWSAG